MFLMLISNYIHVPIIVLTECVIIFLNRINLLESVIDKQHVKYKVRTVFLVAPLNFVFQKANYTDTQIFVGLFSPSVCNNFAIPTKYTETLHTRTRSYILSSFKITIMKIRFQYKTDHLPVAHLTF